MDEGTLKAIGLIKAWYLDSLPVSFKRQLSAYAVRGLELAKAIESGVTLRVDPKAPTAYSSENAVVLPGSYFIEEFYTEGLSLLGLNDSQMVAVALALVNGSQIHEALHVKHDFPGRFDAIIDSFEPGEVKAKAEGAILDRLFVTALNLVFDLANEAWCAKHFVGLNSFLVAKNRVLFNSDLYAKAVSAFSETGDFSAVLALLKCGDWSKSLATLPGLGEVVKLAETARSASLAGNHEAEVRLSLELWELMKSTGSSEGEGEGENEGKGEDEGEGKSGGKSGKANGKGGTAFPSAVIDAEASEAEREAIEKFLASHYVEAESKASEVSRELKAKEYREESEKAFDVVYRDVMQFIDYVGQKVEQVRQYRALGTLFRRMREERHVPGQPRLRGTRIVKRELHRIATDEKVMAYPDSSAVRYGKPEVILLVDASGSMHEVYSTVIDHAYSVFRQFVDAGIPVAAYAHTSLGLDKKPFVCPVLYGIAAFQLPLGRKGQTVVSGNVKSRFARAKSIRLAENFDGYAIKYASSLFTTRPGSKVLIVMSDGLPQGGSVYSGSNAIDHTMWEVARARKAGVTVLAISLTSMVKPYNDKLYGPECNLPAYNQVLLNSSLSKVISQVALERRGV